MQITREYLELNAGPALFNFFLGFAVIMAAARVEMPDDPEKRKHMWTQERLKIEASILEQQHKRYSTRNGTNDEFGGTGVPKCTQREILQQNVSCRGVVPVDHQSTVATKEGLITSQVLVDFPTPRACLGRVVLLTIHKSIPELKSQALSKTRMCPSKHVRVVLRLIFSQYYCTKMLIKKI